MAQAQPMGIQSQGRVPQGATTEEGGSPLGRVCAKLKALPLPVKIGIGLLALAGVGVMLFQVVQDLRGCGCPRDFEFSTGGGGSGGVECRCSGSIFTCRYDCGGTTYCGQRPCGECVESPNSDGSVSWNCTVDSSTL